MRSRLPFLLSSLVLTGCANEAVSPPAVDLEPQSTPNVATADTNTGANTNPSEDKAMPDEDAPTEYNRLTPFEESVIVGKGTEQPFVGEYTDTEDAGTYVCRRCNAPLYRSDQKFHSGCGWPAFDDEIEGAVKRHRDVDGFRIEIVCSHCDGHLGHVFEGEGLTRKNVRHCVNSVSMTFIPEGEKLPSRVNLVSKENEYKARRQKTNPDYSGEP